MKRFFRLPSPAMVVAMVVFVVAMGGSAYAGVKIGTNQLKNGAVTGPKLRDGAVTGSKSDRMWALIDTNGFIIRQSGGIFVDHSLAGVYYIQFPKSLLGRSLVATPSDTVATTISASICGGAAGEQVTCFGTGTNSPDYAYVNTEDSSDTLTNTRFYIQAW